MSHGCPKPLTLKIALLLIQTDYPEVSWLYASNTVLQSCLTDISVNVANKGMLSIIFPSFDTYIKATFLGKHAWIPDAHHQMV